jgi:hypothetical protein
MAPAESVVAGMRITFAVAAGLIVIALAIAFISQALSRRGEGQCAEQHE